MKEELEVIISAETKKFQKEVEKGTEQIQKFGKVSKEADKLVEDALKGIKDTVGKAMKVVSGAIAGATTALAALGEGTKEMRENQAKLNTAFETAGATAGTAQKVYDNLFRVLGDDDTTTEAANHLAKLTTNQKDLAEWTDICQGVYATFGDSLPIEGLTEAANETAKTGKLTGVLADALNWAGINEEIFQEQLDECADESEREQKIRSTLNKTYKEASRKYEETAKKTLKANEAQNKMNKSMKKIGDIVEPIMSQILEIGAALLSKLQKPLEKLTEFISNTVLPIVEEAIDFVLEHKDMIITAIVAVSGVVLAMKGHLLLAKAAQEGLTAATAASTAAHKIFVEALGLTPVGAFTGAMALIVGAVGAFTMANRDAWMGLDEAQLKVVKSAQNAAKEYQNTLSTFGKNAETLVSEKDRNKELADELFRMVDANGKIKEGYEDRAAYIAGELAEATGTEIEIVDGVIQKYDELRDSIYKSIEARAAEKILAEHEEAYAEAMKNKGEATKAATALYGEYTQQLKVVQRNEDELEKLRKEAATKTAFYQRDEKAALEEQIKAKENALSNEKNLLNRKQIAYWEAANVSQKYYDTINAHQEAAILIANGNTEQALEILGVATQGVMDYSGSVDEATRNNLDKLGQNAVDAGNFARLAKENFDAGIDGWTQEMVDQAETDYTAAIGAFTNAYADAKEIGNNFSNGVIDALTANGSTLNGAARTMFDSLTGAIPTQYHATVEITGKYTPTATNIPKPKFPGFKPIGGDGTKPMLPIPRQEVSLNVDGEKLGSVVVKGINSITQNTGHLPLVMG